jgi:oligopeptide/dipeptide ABC transporter ATP-binding protein
MTARDTQVGTPVPLIAGDELSVTFAGRRGSAPVRAVTDASFVIQRGETVGLVGESGCGKSTLGRALVGLRPLSGGSLAFAGRTVDLSSRGQLRLLRRNVQMVFQDPFGSLDPEMRIGESIAEPMASYRLLRRSARADRVGELLARVGLDERMARRFPHEFSGGQRQRVAIARALALDPQLLVCDEPTSALDVSIQAQVLNLLKQLRTERDLTMLFISHDLAVVRHLCSRIIVMYLGRIIETGDSETIFDRPAHPYTRALLSAAPTGEVGQTRRDRIVLSGDLPSPLAPPAGCAFHPRCWLYRELGSPERCRREIPFVRTVTSTASAACHFSAAMAGAPDTPPADRS